MSAMLNRFSTDIATGVATVAGAKPPRTLVKNKVFYKASVFSFLFFYLQKNAIN